MSQRSSTRLSTPSSSSNSSSSASASEATSAPAPASSLSMSSFSTLPSSAGGVLSFSSSSSSFSSSTLPSSLFSFQTSPQFADSFAESSLSAVGSGTTTIGISDANFAFTSSPASSQTEAAANFPTFGATVATNFSSATTAQNIGQPGAGPGGNALSPSSAAASAGGSGAAAGAAGRNYARNALFSVGTSAAKLLDRASATSRAMPLVRYGLETVQKVAAPLVKPATSFTANQWTAYGDPLLTQLDKKIDSAVNVWESIQNYTAIGTAATASAVAAVTSPLTARQFASHYYHHHHHPHQHQHQQPAASPTGFPSSSASASSSASSSGLGIVGASQLSPASAALSASNSTDVVLLDAESKSAFSALYFSRLKERFINSRWYGHVDEILLQNAVVKAFSEKVGHLQRPAEIFYNSLTEEFMDSHASLDDFLHALKSKLGPAWDERLIPLARAFYTTAKAVSTVFGAGRFVGGAIQLGRAKVNHLMDDLLARWDRVLSMTDGMVEKWLPDVDQNPNQASNMASTVVFSHGILQTDSTAVASPTATGMRNDMPSAAASLAIPVRARPTSAASVMNAASLSDSAFIGSPPDPQAHLNDGLEDSDLSSEELDGDGDGDDSMDSEEFSDGAELADEEDERKAKGHNEEVFKMEEERELTGRLNRKKTAKNRSDEEAADALVAAASPLISALTDAANSAAHSHGHPHAHAHSHTHTHASGVDSGLNVSDVSSGSDSDDHDRRAVRSSPQKARRGKRTTEDANLYSLDELDAELQHEEEAEVMAMTQSMLVLAEHSAHSDSHKASLSARAHTTSNAAAIGSGVATATAISNSNNTALAIHAPHSISSSASKMLAITSKVSKRLRQRMPSLPAIGFRGVRFQSVGSWVDDLKARLIERAWFNRVDDILMQNMFVRALSTFIRPAEHFFNTSLTLFSQRPSLTLAALPDVDALAITNAAVESVKQEEQAEVHANAPGSAVLSNPSANSASAAARSDDRSKRIDQLSVNANSTINTLRTVHGDDLAALAAQTAALSLSAASTAQPTGQMPLPIAANASAGVFSSSSPSVSSSASASALAFASVSAESLGVDAVLTAKNVMDDFVVHLRSALGASWDDRLVQYARSFFAIASLISLQYRPRHQQNAA